MDRTINLFTIRDNSCHKKSKKEGGVRAMKKNILLMSFSALLLLGGANAYSMPVMPVGEYIEYEDWSAEFLVDVNSPAGQIDPGDKLIGIMSLDKISGLSSGQLWSSSLTTNESLLGYFQYTVSTITPTSTPSEYTITFDTNLSNSFITYYYHNSYIDLPILAASTNVANTISTVQSGSIYLHGQLNYWTGIGPILVSDFLAGKSATFCGGFDAVVNNTGTEWKDLAIGELFNPLGFAALGRPEGVTEFYTMPSTLYGAPIALQNKGWQMVSTDVRTYAYAVPEPTSILLLGSGLLGLAGIGFRKKKRIA